MKELEAFSHFLYTRHPFTTEHTGICIYPRFIEFITAFDNLN